MRNMRARPLTIALSLASACAIGVGVGPASAAQAKRSDAGIDLCGLTNATDAILDCDDVSTPPASGPGDSSSADAAPAVPASGAPTPAPAASADAAAVVPPLAEIAPPRQPAGARTFVPNHVIVKFRRGTSASAIASVLGAAGVTPIERVRELGFVVGRVAPGRREAALKELQASRAVEVSERDGVVYLQQRKPNDSIWPEQWGLQLIGLPDAWEVTVGSPAIKVAVLDSGVDSSHPDLRGAVLPGYDFVNGDGAPDDDNGHGTAVAGVIAARTNNGTGASGVCWTCSILPVKVLSNTGHGEMSDVAKGIVYAADHGARVINLSLGGAVASELVSDAVQYATEKGVVLVGAAGNAGANTPYYPAADPSVVSVAATDRSDRLYSWSNHGAWVSVTAPGCNIGPIKNGGFEQVSGPGYADFCGTSSATPIVSGLAGLALAARPDATPAEIVDALRRSTTPASTDTQGGRVSAPTMLGALGRAVPGDSRVDPAAPPQPNGQSVLRWRFTGSVNARKGLVYTVLGGAGSVNATLASKARTPFTLTLFSAGGVKAAQITAVAPIHVGRGLPDKTVRIAITGRGAFELRVERPSGAS